MTATASPPDARATADCLNPILASTRAVFESMLGCVPQRTALTLNTRATTSYDISGVIGITGSAAGTIVFSLSAAVAAAAYERLTGQPLDEVPSDERDARLSDVVGELTNMIAGGAKARLQQMSLSLSIPNIACGKGHVVRFPTSIVPMSLAFESEIGPFSVDFGFSF